ncbi:protein-glutamate O-methyltransferase CheR [Elioraea sp.]|jgi:chemotaxis protein methyltransferase CheR|uniref:CheR family methyltransferase n=1 Tax=Elioraea sp. TaxID=2185103 RepID=UPI0021DDE0C0|nr:protein-glutamate O-methyltransferase CheR [Elioraea sp.]GIX09714.1 MAG: chemotaxis protein CheR [Elioraea sp.]
MSSASFSQLAEFLQTRSGLVLTPDKMYLVETRLGPLMKREGLPDLSALVGRVKAALAGPIANEVVELMTTNETLFFRDGKPFEHLKEKVWPRLGAARGPAGTIRVWSAACSTGQEAYSVAMSALDNAAALNGCRVEILGTDIARDVLKRAEQGRYSQFEVQRGLPIAALMKHFTKEGSDWRVKDALRAMVRWREWNLLDPPTPLGRFDVVFLRNVLIYFDQPTKARVLDQVASVMAPDGVLYLGGAETVLGITTRFVPIDGVRSAYGLA